MTARKPRQTRTAYLETLLRSRMKPEHGQLWVEFRPFKGWFLVGDEPRWIGDDGDEIGANWRDAERSIRYIFVLECAS